jgi:hypothetical protein
MRPAAEQADLQAVARGGDDSRTHADGAGRSDHHVLTEHDVGFGEAVEEPVIDHRLGAFPGLLRRLEHCHHRPAPAVAGSRKQRRRTDEPGDMHIVAAGMHHRDRLPVAVRGSDFTGIRQAGGLLDRQRIHIGAQHDRRPCAVAQEPDDAGLPDRRRHVVIGGAQPRRCQSGCPRLLHRQLGMGVHVCVKRLQLREQVGKTRQRRIGKTCLVLTHQSAFCAPMP